MKLCFYVKQYKNNNFVFKIKDFVKTVRGVKHKGWAAAFGPRELGLNPGED